MFRSGPETARQSTKQSAFTSMQYNEFSSTGRAQHRSIHETLGIIRTSFGLHLLHIRLTCSDLVHDDDSHNVLCATIQVRERTRHLCALLFDVWAVLPRVAVFWSDLYSVARYRSSSVIRRLPANCDCVCCPPNVDHRPIRWSCGKSNQRTRDACFVSKTL